MTEKIEGVKNGNQWQFISDENDIETIMKKLDWIAEVINECTRISFEQQRKYNEVFRNESKE